MRRAERSVVTGVILVLAVLWCSGCGRTGPTNANGKGPRPVPQPVYGVTIDDVANMAQVVDGARAFGHFPTTRVVLDYSGTSDSVYASAVRQLHPYSFVMAELLDSSDMAQAETNPSAESRRVSGYLAGLGRYVDIWEVGNEVNGSWTCPTTPCDSPGYEAGAELTVDAYQRVAAAGFPAALTLYYNSGCPSDPGELDPISYTTRYLDTPAGRRMRNGLRYVLLSYYETQCANQRLSARTLATYMEHLHTMYPNARVGIGELGLRMPISACDQRHSASPGCFDPTRFASPLAQAESMIAYYYGLKTGLASYVGGYFWWYYDEDALPYRGNPIWRALDSAFGTER